MQHSIPVEKIGPLGPPMANAVQNCVHCGFCLPACPTYQLFGEEMDSPRGRIFLMKEVLEGNLPVQDCMSYIDRCLGCVACETACPSGVAYGDLITSFRSRADRERRRSWLDRVLRWFVLSTLPYPRRFRLAVMFGRLGLPLRGVLPKRMKGMLELLPRELPDNQPLPEIYPAEGERRARVALLSGCAQQVLAPEINWATLRVLAKNGVEVVVPKRQTCCGALAAHTGEARQAREFARRNMEAFPKDVDAIVTNAAGCGSGMHEYGLWLKGEPEEEAASAFSKRVKDVSVFLAELGLVGQYALKKTTRVAYHDACHLAHAQRVSSEPRRVLAAIDNLQLVEIPNGEFCCGSAGTYNIEQPEAAAKFGQQKAKAIASVGANMVATGNIGCMTQIETHLRQQGSDLAVVHTMQLLDLAVQ